MHPYSEGDRVAIVLDGAQQKGMPHRRFQGKTGIITGSQGRAYVVSVSDGNANKTVVARRNTSGLWSENHVREGVHRLRYSERPTGQDKRAPRRTFVRADHGSTTYAEWAASENRGGTKTDSRFLQHLETSWLKMRNSQDIQRFVPSWQNSAQQMFQM